MGRDSRGAPKPHDSADIVEPLAKRAKVRDALPRRRPMQASDWQDQTPSSPMTRTTAGASASASAGELRPREPLPRHRQLQAKSMTSKPADVPGNATVASTPYNDPPARGPVASSIVVSEFSDGVLIKQTGLRARSPSSTPGTGSSRRPPTPPRCLRETASGISVSTQTRRPPKMVNKAVQVGRCGLKVQSKARPRRPDTNATDNPEETSAPGQKDTRAKHDDLRRQAADAVLTSAPWKRRQKARAGAREPAKDGASEGSARTTTTSANPVASMTPLPTTTTSRQDEAAGKNAAASGPSSMPQSKVPSTAAGADPQEEIMELRFDQLQEMQRSAASRRHSVIQRARAQQQQNASSSTDVADASLSHAPTTASNASSAYMKKRPPHAALSCLACFILCGYIAPVTGLYMVLLMYWWTFAGIVPARSDPLAIVARCLRGAYKMQCPLIHIFLSGPVILWMVIYLLQEFWSQIHSCLAATCSYLLQQPLRSQWQNVCDQAPAVATVLLCGAFVAWHATRHTCHWSTYLVQTVVIWMRYLHPWCFYTCGCLYSYTKVCLRLLSTTTLRNTPPPVRYCRPGPKSGGPWGLWMLILLSQLLIASGVEARVGAPSVGAPGAAQTVLPGRHQAKLHRQRKEQGDFIVKRSFLRAQRRLQKHGTTWYRNRLYTHHDELKPIPLRSGPQPNDPNQARYARPRTAVPNLPSWPLQQPTQSVTPIQSSDVGVVTINVGGLSKEGYDELAQWLNQPSTLRNVQIVFLQETWRSASEFSTQHWHWILSGAGQTAKANNGSGVAVLINNKLASSSHIRYQEWLPGRLLEVRITEDKRRPLLHRPITLVCAYQHSRISHSPEVYAKRLRFWEKLQKCLDAVPTRHTLIFGGDINTGISPMSRLVGKGAQVSTNPAQDQSEWQDIVQLHRLCLLNTWGSPAKTATYVGTEYSTLIDFLGVRERDSGHRAKLSRPQSQIHLFSWRSGARHLPVYSVITLKNPYHQAMTSSTQSHTARMDHLGMAHTLLHDPQQVEQLRSVVRNRLTCALQDQPVDAIMHPMRIDAILRQGSKDLFPGTHLGSRPTEVWDNEQTKLSLKHVWQARAQLRRHTLGPPLRVAFHLWRAHWRLVKARKALHSQSNKARRDKWDQQLTEAEEAYQKHDSHSFFAIVRRLAPRRPRQRIMMRNKDGTLCTPQEEIGLIHDYWRGVFDVPTLPKCSGYLWHGLNITTREVEMAISKLSMRKASAPTSAPLCSWRACAPDIAPLIQEYLAQHWGEGEHAGDEDIARSWLVFLGKPNKPSSKPENLRPIALQPAPAKIMALLLRWRLQPYVEQLLHQCPQYAYTRGRTTTDAISRIAQHCDSVRAKVKQQTLSLHDRRQGAVRTVCTGGAQLTVDCSKAFDSLPRCTMMTMLTWAGVPPDLATAIIQVHQAGTYRHGNVDDPESWMDIDSAQGVRQGCMLAPCLWLLFVTYLFHHLDTTMGGAASWTCQHSTAFADDLHFKWDLDDPKALDRMKMEVATVLSVLKSFGLQISAEKSTMLIEIRGTAADVWLSKNIYKDDENNKHFRYDTFAKLSIPIGTQFKYLGVILSYRNYELASVKHRVQQAAIHHSRLRRILQGRGGISRHQRLRLWRICIQTSQLYGLEATGVTEAGIKLLHVQMLRHLRAITGRPRHLDRSTDQELLDSLKMASVRQMLSQRLQSANTRLCSNTDLPCYDKDNILRRIQALQAGLDRSICTQRVSTALTTPVQQAPHDDVTPQDQQVRLQELPADTKQFRCQVCGQSFPSLHLVKTHEGKAHKILAPKRELPQDRSVYSINGLPQCRFCGYKFTKWSGLQRHIQRNGCPILRHEDPATFAAAAPATTNKAEDPLRTTQHAWVADSTIATIMPSTGDQPLVQDTQLQQDASQYTWTKVLHMWRTKHDFKNVCVFCGQWAVDASALKQHYAKQHQALTNPWNAAYRAECKQLAKVAVEMEDMPDFDADSQIQSLLGGLSSVVDLKPLLNPTPTPARNQSHLTNKRPRAEQWTRGTGSKGGGKGKGMASNGTLSQEDLQQLLRQIVVLLLRQGDQLNRLQTDTGYYLVFQVPGDATMVPVLIAGALEWRNQKKADPTKLTMSLRIALIGLFLKELQMRLEKIRANDQLQEKLKEQGLMTDEGAWTYRQWCPKNKALQLQLSRDPIKWDVLMTHITNALQGLNNQDHITRFQATKALEEGQMGPTLPFLLDISLKPSACRLHQSMRALVDCSAMEAVGARIRPQRAKRSQLQDQLQEWLRGRYYHVGCAIHTISAMPTLSSLPLHGYLVRSRSLNMPRLYFRSCVLSASMVSSCCVCLITRPSRH
ncbi:unnamed protein product [Symbiodinium sp. CCMP2592]|nr:unnamed protein product [Symbiodinium sp. CCMP2592]